MNVMNKHAPLKTFIKKSNEPPRFQDFKIYFPQKTQNTNKYTDSHITCQDTANSTDNTYIDDRTNIASITYKTGSII